MWTSTISFRQLRERARWKVENFCEVGISKPEAAFDWIALGTVADERKETLDPQSYPEHVFNYLSLEHVQSMTGDLIEFAPRLGKEIRSRTKVFRQGDILYGRLRPYLNKVFLATGSVSSSICSTEFYVLIPRVDLVLPNFLRAVLSSHYVQQYVKGLQTGSALPRLQLDDLMKIELPLPPIAAQSLYEEFLRHETIRRRQIAAELAILPQAALDAVVNALESGGEPSMPILQFGEYAEEIDCVPLPDDRTFIKSEFVNGVLF